MSAGLVQILKDVQMKIIYEHTISLSSNECVILNTSLGRKYHPILEGDNVGDVGTWRLNHKGPNAMPTSGSSVIRVRLLKTPPSRRDPVIQLTSEPTKNSCTPKDVLQSSRRR